MSTRWTAPVLYIDAPGTVVTPLSGGYELVQRPNGPSVCRRQLSRARQRRHARLHALSMRGYHIVSVRPPGYVVHPSDPSRTFTIAAAAQHEGLT